MNPQTETIKKTVFARIEAEREQWGPEGDLGPGTQTLSSDAIIKALNSNEDGDARLYIELHRYRFCYDHAAGRWYKFTNHFWEEDVLDEATGSIEKVINLYGEEAQRQAWNRVKTEKAGQKNDAKKHEVIEAALLKRIRALQTKGRKENILFLARTGPASLGVTGQEWDRDPWLLGCLNGVIDLQTGEHRPGRPDDFIKTVAPTEWKGLNEPAPSWEKFLTEIFVGGGDLIDYLQRLFGYCITGRVTEHISPILWGKGRNGKGTLLETLGHVLGPYTGQIEAELILKQKFSKPSGGPSSDIMTLRGKRLVWVSETDEGRRLNTGKLKWLSGGDTLTGREVYGKRQTSFKPTHKLFLLTNHKPHANADDYALWKRISLIPFNLSFVSEPTLINERLADPTLPDRLKSVASGILAWLVRGCLDWQAEGLTPPQRVKAATEEYKQEEDTIRVFINECCQTGASLEVRAGNLYSCFKKWCEDTGIKPINGTVFGNQIKERFDSYPRRNRVFYVGLDILQEPKC